LGVETLVYSMLIHVFANASVTLRTVTAKVGDASVPINLILVGAVDTAWHWCSPLHEMVEFLVGSFSAPAASQQFLG
jgi:hypothetical protein